MDQPRTDVAGPDSDAAGSPARDLPSIIATYQTPLLRYVRRLTGPGEDAEDIVQEAFLRLHRATEKDGPDSIQSLASWLYRVAHNLSMDRRRKRLRRTRARDRVIAKAQADARRTAEPEAMDVMVNAEAAHRALEALGRLPEDQQQVLRLKVIDGLTLREVGEVLGMSIGNVHYRLNRGLADLARVLKADGDI